MFAEVGFVVLGCFMLAASIFTISSGGAGPFISCVFGAFMCFAAAGFFARLREILQSIERIAGILERFERQNIAPDHAIDAKRDRRIERRDQVQRTRRSE